MPLKQSYPTLESVPEADRAHYVPREGRYELDVEGVASLAGILAKNAELLTQHAADKRRISELENQVVLPDGHAAVTTSDQRRLQEFDKLGKKAEELKSIITGYNELKEQSEHRARSENYKRAAKAAGYAEDAFAALAEREGLETEVATESDNGKAVERAYIVKEGKRTLLTEYVPAADAFKPFLRSLTVTQATSGTPVGFAPASGALAPKSIVDTFLEERQRQNSSKPDPLGLQRAAL